MQITLRPYQKECLNLIDSLESGSYLINLATGLGKTVIFTNIKRKGRMLVLAHREELVKQPIKYFDCPVGIESVQNKKSLSLLKHSTILYHKNSKNVRTV